MILDDNETLSGGLGPEFQSALRSLGYLFPENPEELDDLMTKITQLPKKPLPPEIQDPMQLLAQVRVKLTKNNNLGADRTIQNAQCATRECTSNSADDRAKSGGGHR